MDGMIAHLKEYLSGTALTPTSERDIINNRRDLQYPLYSLPIEGCVYRGEGNANLVVAVPSERKVIRLRKSATSESRSNVDPESCNQEKDVQRDVEFIRGVISDLLGSYVRVPEILRVGQSEIARLADKIRPVRPDSRRHKDIFAGFATRLPDYAFLPEHLSNFSDKPTFCVEIKPKQGFICDSDRLLKKCPYCLKQYYKTQTSHNDAAEARTSTRQHLSEYCPLDLFSSQNDRIKKAIRCLLKSPQNNLRIFRNGNLAYGQLQFEKNGDVELRKTLSGCFKNKDFEVDVEMFVNLVVEAIGRPFFEEERDVFGKFEEAEEAAMKKFEEIGVEVCERRPNLSLVQEVNELLGRNGQECQTPSSWSSLHHHQISDGGGGASSHNTLNSYASKKCISNSSVTSRIFRMQSLHQCGSDFVAWSRARCGDLLHDDMTQPDLVEIRDSYYLNHKETVQVNIEDWKQNDKTDSKSDRNNTEIHHFVNVLINYLLFCTARDCSILISFQQVNRESCPGIDPINRIDLSENHSFLVGVRVVDLDLKKLSCIDKHRRRDEDVLRATIDQLR